MQSDNIPMREIEEIKEFAFNEQSKLIERCKNNPYKIMMEMANIIARVYAKGFDSGYEQRRLDELINKSEQ